MRLLLVSSLDLPKRLTSTGDAMRSRSKTCINKTVADIYIYIIYIYNNMIYVYSIIYILNIDIDTIKEVLWVQVSLDS